MDLVTWGELLLVIIILAVLIPIAWLTLRRRWLSRQGGMFDCSVRLTATTPGTGWVLGVARYSGENLQWFRTFSLSFRPRLTFLRAETRAGSQRRPTPVESVLLFDDQQIVELVSTHGRSWEVAMAPGSLTGLLSWLEASPPGMSYRAFPR